MGTPKQQKGARGEDIAAEYLEKLGYTIIKRNARLSHLEIDIIAQDKNCLVFVEVKHALTDDFGHPAAWINKKKQERLRRAVQRYIDTHDIGDKDFRIDAVTIYKGEIEHYKAAF
ncbi:MAG: YraN family protein [Candidatus Zixiibacteriota bacterium]